MSFPIRASFALSTQGSDQTTHPVAMPSGLTSGELILTLGGHDGTPSETYTGHSHLVNEAGGSGGGGVSGNVFWRISDGTEGASDDYTTGSGQESALATIRLQDHDSSTNPPEASVIDHDTATTSATPPALTPTGGAKDYKWIIILVLNDEASVSSIPTGFTQIDDFVSGGGSSGGIRVVICEKDETASSITPGAFTHSSALAVVATIAIHPGSEGPSGGGGGGSTVIVNIFA